MPSSRLGELLSGVQVWRNSRGQSADIKVRNNSLRGKNVEIKINMFFQVLLQVSNISVLKATFVVLFCVVALIYLTKVWRFLPKQKQHYELFDNFTSFWTQAGSVTLRLTKVNYEATIRIVFPLLRKICPYFFLSRVSNYVLCRCSCFRDFPEINTI